MVQVFNYYKLNSFNIVTKNKTTKAKYFFMLHWLWVLVEIILYMSGKYILPHHYIGVVPAPDGILVSIFTC